MDHKQAGRFWDDNAEAWTRLARAGFDVYLSQRLNLLIDNGFRLERLAEPRPDDKTLRECPALQDAQVVAYFLHVRARKPV